MGFGTIVPFIWDHPDLDTCKNYEVINRWLCEYKKYANSGIKITLKQHRASIKSIKHTGRSSCNGKKGVSYQKSMCSFTCVKP